MATIQVCSKACILPFALKSGEKTYIGMVWWRFTIERFYKSLRNQFGSKGINIVFTIWFPFLSKRSKKCRNTMLQITFSTSSLKRYFNTVLINKSLKKLFYFWSQIMISYHSTSREEYSSIAIYSTTSWKNNVMATQRRISRNF